MANKAVVRRFVEEVVNQGNTRLLADLVAAEHVGHYLDGDVYGPEGVRIEIAELRAAFPDLTVVIADLMAAGDRVVCRFVLRGTHGGPLLGIAATGRAVAVGGIALDRLAGGKLVESWCSLDTLELLRQLGVQVQIATEANR